MYAHHTNTIRIKNLASSSICTLPFPPASGSNKRILPNILPYLITANKAISSQALLQIQVRIVFIKSSQSQVHSIRFPFARLSVPFPVLNRPLCCLPNLYFLQSRRKKFRQ